MEEIKVRPEIVFFAKAMEKIMAENDKEKGDSWRHMPHDELQSLFLEEVEETKEDNAKLKEWIDVALFCMMIYNNTVGRHNPSQITNKTHKEK